ncbi:hypothetical protein PROFUN_00072 [Planoprotostelium fungivorum]|uniref:Uncharacterized protein n=1 Tax=Planoprotostelium fungivorum TaxID=1890364 RepID=A0A2P6P0K4_9EUKA|nr:hypothetical protein PROFUN_00072 [Planoprotostelium fungivorum]
MDNNGGHHDHLKSAFVAAANQLTKLYTQSLTSASEAYQQGYQRSHKDVQEWLVKHQQAGKKTISIEEILRRKTEAENSTAKEENASSLVAPEYQFSDASARNHHQNASQAFGFSFGPAPPNGGGQNMFSTISEHPIEGSRKRLYDSNSCMDFSYGDAQYKRTRGEEPE